jgi:CheY-like chemotaxis protein
LKLNSQKDLDKLRHVPIDGQKRMLIVEDSDHIVKLLKGIFKNKYIVETAANGLEGLKKTSLQNFDIIISDISMPVMSGIEFYSEVAKHDPDIGRHFLFYSAYTGEHIDFLKKFDLRHITKPIPIKKIRRTVEDMLKTYKSEITSYQKMNDRICSLLVSNHSLACLYIDCSNMNNIEGHFGKKIYLDVLRKIHNLLSDIKGKHLRQDDIIVSNGVAGDEFIVFLAKKRYDRDFCPTDLVGICNRITALINNNINPVTIPYLRGRPKIAVGYAVIIHNPLIRDERLINKLIEDAKLMSTYQEFKRQMRNKEKLQELILKESIKTVFQPVVDFTNNEIIGYEALTRGPEGTEYEYPYILFDVAEETDLLFHYFKIQRSILLMLYWKLQKERQSKIMTFLKKLQHIILT